MSKRPTVAVARERTVDAQMTKDRHRWWGVFGIMIGFVLVTGLIATQTAPKPFSIAFVVLVLACAAAFLRPTVGVYLIVFLDAHRGHRDDAVVAVHEEHVEPGVDLLRRRLVVDQPAGGAPRRDHGRRGCRAPRGPVVALQARRAVLAGRRRSSRSSSSDCCRGIGSGGDRIIGLFEARPLLYMPLIYILLTNLLTTRAQYRRARRHGARGGVDPEHLLAARTTAASTARRRRTWRASPSTRRRST